MSQMNNHASTSMDAKKFVRLLNGSAQSRIAFFENKLKELSEGAGCVYHLVGLYADKMIYECDGTYYQANIRKDGNKIVLEHITEVIIEEIDKKEQFEEACLEFVNGVASDDYAAINKAMHKLESQRFRSTVIPESGFITPRDGVTRKVKLNSRAINESFVKAITNLVCESFNDSVTVDESGAPKLTFVEGGLKIPVNEFIKYQVNMRKAKRIAEEAWKETNFQDLIETTAGFICNQQLEDAVMMVTPFLKEHQEFCLLNSTDTRNLVENALSTRGIFNYRLIEDVANTFRITNLKINRNDIHETFNKITAQSPNSKLISEASELINESDLGSFVIKYDEFLGSVLNEQSDAEVSKAFLNALKLIRQEIKIPEELGELKGKLEDLIGRLESGSDDKAFKDAADLLANIDDSLIDKITTLKDFDKGIEPGEGFEKPFEEPEGEPIGAVKETKPKEEPKPEVGGVGDLGGLGELEPEFGGEGGPKLELGPEKPELGKEEKPGEEKAGEVPPAGEEKSAEDIEKELGIKPEEEVKAEGVIYIENMNIKQLNEELQMWNLNVDRYLVEDGFADCHDQLSRCIKRCQSIGHDADDARIQFEALRDTIVMDKGTVIYEKVEKKGPKASNTYGGLVKKVIKPVDEKGGASAVEKLNGGVAKTGPDMKMDNEGDLKGVKATNKGSIAEDGVISPKIGKIKKGGTNVTAPMDKGGVVKQNVTPTPATNDYKDPKGVKKHIKGGLAEGDATKDTEVVLDILKTVDPKEKMAKIEKATPEQRAKVVAMQEAAKLEENDIISRIEKRIISEEEKIDELTTADPKTDQKDAKNAFLKNMIAKAGEYAPKKDEKPAVEVKKEEEEDKKVKACEEEEAKKACPKEEEKAAVKEDTIIIAAASDNPDEIDAAVKAIAAELNTQIKGVEAGGGDEQAQIDQIGAGILEPAPIDGQEVIEPPVVEPEEDGEEAEELEKKAEKKEKEAEKMEKKAEKLEKKEKEEKEDKFPEKLKDKEKDKDEEEEEEVEEKTEVITGEE